MSIKSNTIIGLIVCLCGMAIADEGKPSRMNRPAAHSVGAFDGNQIDCDMENNGMFVSHRISGHSGLEWPQGENTYSIYASGLFLVGRINGELRSAVAEYGPEFSSGPWGSDPADPDNRIFKVNRDDLIHPEGNPDFADWPVHQGAPWVDENDDGIYEPLPEGPDHPEFMGDQVIYYVMNDGDQDNHIIFGTEPLDVEVRVIIWGYRRAPELEDIFFVQARIYNKSSQTIEEFHLGLWSDPDLGDAGDDFVGCDTTLNLGYAYNDGPDSRYGDAPPAVGLKMLQAAVPSELAQTPTFAFGRPQEGFKNVDMISFVKFIGSDNVYTDPNSVQATAHYLNGFKRDGTPFINRATGETTKFICSDDPNDNIDNTDLIWVDGDDNPSDDRRFLMGCEPFDFQSGDSAEFTFAMIHARGLDALNSVTVLKRVSEQTQRYHDAHYSEPEPPPAPLVSTTSLSGSIILEWDSSPEASIEEDTFGGQEYHFEGYNIYQIAGDRGEGEPIKIASFDMINGITAIVDERYWPEYDAWADVIVQQGTDSGLQHYYQIDEDAFTQGPLIDGRAYYFAVTAYSYSELAGTHFIESDLLPLLVRPARESFAEIVRDTVALHPALKATHSQTSDGQVSYMITNPAKITGHDYQVGFRTVRFENDSLETTTWDLTDLTSGAVVLDSQTVQSGIDLRTGLETGSLGAQSVAGLQLMVENPPLGLHGVWQTSNGNGAIPGVDDDTNENIMWINFLYAPDYPTEQAAGSWFFVTHEGGNRTISGFHAQVFRGDNYARASSSDLEMRFTESALQEGLGFRKFDDGAIVSVPFELWNLRRTPDDPSDDYRMIPAIVNGEHYQNDVDQFDFWGDDPSSSASNDPASDVVFWGNPGDTSPGESGYLDFFEGGLGSTVPSSKLWEEVLANTRLMNWNGYASHADSVRLDLLSSPDPDLWTFADTILLIEAGLFVDPDNTLGDLIISDTHAHGLVLHLPEVGTVYRWVINKPNIPGDQYTFSTRGLEPTPLNLDMSTIRVWPNPYFGFHPEEGGYFDSQIHFINLPERATIKIINLSGQMVRVLQHAGSHTAIWDVRNAHNAMVASGVYIVLISTDQGEVTLKLAVVVRQM